MFLRCISNEIIKLSQLSHHEIVLLKGHFASTHYVKCDETVEEYVKSGHSHEIALQTVQKRNKCNTYSKDAVHEMDNLLFHTCVCNFKHPYFYWFMECYAAFEKGILPYSGNYSEQPAKIIEVIYLIQVLKMEYNVYMQKKHEPKG